MSDKASALLVIAGAAIVAVGAEGVSLLGHGTVQEEIRLAEAGITEEEQQVETSWFTEDGNFLIGASAAMATGYFLAIGGLALIPARFTESSTYSSAKGQENAFNNLSLMLSISPAGYAKDFQEAITGVNAITGIDLSTTDRLLSSVGILPIMPNLRHLKNFDDLFKRGDDVVPNVNLTQQKVVDSVKNPETDLVNPQKPKDYTAQGNYGEMNLDIESTGSYNRVSSDRVTSLDAPMHQGIDGVYKNANPPPDFIVADAKYMSNDKIPSTNNTKNSGRQLSAQWIDANLDKAVVPETAKAVRESMKNGNVVVVVSKVDTTGKVTHYLVDSTGKVMKDADGNAIV